MLSLTAGTAGSLQTCPHWAQTSSLEPSHNNAQMKKLQSLKKPPPSSSLSPYVIAAFLARIYL